MVWKIMVGSSKKKERKYGVIKNKYSKEYSHWDGVKKYAGIIV